MTKVLLTEGLGPYGGAPHRAADLDDAVKGKIDDAARGYDDRMSAMAYQIETLTGIVGMLAKVINEAGLIGTGDVAEIIGHKYSVEY